jgi:hypothetical protein
MSECLIFNTNWAMFHLIHVVYIVYWQEQDTFLWAYDDCFVLPVDRVQHIELDFIECKLTKRTTSSLQVVFVTDPVFALTP